MRKQMAEDIHSIPMFEGVETLLQKLAHNKIKMAIVSSNSVENIRQVLGQELMSLISQFECGVSILGKGPKLRKVLSKCGISKMESIYIGDEIRDIDAANHIGMSSGAVSWGYNTVESLLARHPSELFSSIEDLATKILA